MGRFLLTWDRQSEVLTIHVQALLVQSSLYVQLRSYSVNGRQQNFLSVKIKRRGQFFNRLLYFNYFLGVQAAGA